VTAPEVEAELDALYTAPLSEFVARRDALAKRLRAEGAADDSTRVKALRKPNAVAWAINRLHLERDGLGELERASEALRAALGRAATAEKRRESIENRRRALERTASAVVAILEQAGSAVSPAQLRRIEGTLLALASAGPAGRGEVHDRAAPRAGRLDQELEPPGFDAVFGAPAPPAAAPQKQAAPAPRAVATTAPAKTKAGARRGGSRTSEEAPAAGRPASPSRGAAASGAASRSRSGSKSVSAPTVPPRDGAQERAVRSAQAALDGADGELERATEKVEASRMRVTDAEKALAAARREVDAARRELAAVRARRDEARRELDRARGR